MILAFHKPYGVLSQFTPNGSKHRTLAEFGFPKTVYPIGRLDADSEGLLLLTDERHITEWLLNPKYQHRRIYWAQVERVPTPEDLGKLAKGVVIAGYRTRPCRAQILEPQPDVPPRIPPIRYRKSVPTCWIELELFEGKNRQVRKMTAAIGFPTLRLIRTQIGKLTLGKLAAGEWKVLSESERQQLFEKN